MAGEASKNLQNLTYLGLLPTEFRNIESAWVPYPADALCGMLG
jgi:hypothetical protein